MLTHPHVSPIETLETRRLLSLTLEGSTLVFEGTENADQLAIWRNGAGDLVVWIDGNQLIAEGDLVDDFHAIGLGGNDVLRVDFRLGLPSTLDGGTGDDKLIGGASSDLLIGGDGLDRFFGNDGNDTLNPGLGADQLFGAGGRDTADYSSRTDDISFNQFPDRPGGFGRVSGDDGEDILGLDIERLVGGSGNDRFVGDERPNTFIGGAGNDLFVPHGGNDALLGEGGNDTLIGDAGDDFLDGGSGDDSLYGQQGHDNLQGQGGNDQLFANDNARDTVNGGSNSDIATSDGLDVVSNVEIHA
jgi:Ca2+-binding RTX toxin-like protein